MKNRDKKIVPKLRFKGFDDSWNKKRLNTLADKVVDKNSCLLARVLTNSATDGIVEQKKYFEREIVTTSNISNYFVVDKNDYVYNPRISANAPVGPISKNHIGKGIMSPLYTVFRFRNIENDFFEHYFNSNHWHKYILDEANTGARFDRISISDAKFLNMPIALPTEKEEQQKIADCLTSLDDLINAENEKLEFVKEHKKGLMQKLFPAEGETMPEWRFPEFRASEEWEQKKLSSIGVYIRGFSYKATDTTADNNKLLIIRSNNIKQMGNTDYREDLQFVNKECKYEQLLVKNDITICMANGSRHLVGKSSYYDGNYEGDITVGAFCGIYRSPLSIIRWLFQSDLYKNSIDNTLQGGNGAIANLKKEDIENLKFYIPKEQKEQQKIADCLSSIDRLIEEQAKKIEQLKDHKRGLLQGLFPSLEEAE